MIKNEDLKNWTCFFHLLKKSLVSQFNQIQILHTTSDDNVSVKYKVTVNEEAFLNNEKRLSKNESCYLFF